MTEQTQGNEPLTRAEFEGKLIAKAWQDDTFKQRLITDAKAVWEEEIGRPAPEEVKITVVEETPTQYYMVIPVKPAIEDGEELTDEALEAVAGGAGGIIFRSGGKNYFIWW